MQLTILEQLGLDYRTLNYGLKCVNPENRNSVIENIKNTLAIIDNDIWLFQDEINNLMQKYELPDSNLELENLNRAIFLDSKISEPAQKIVWWLWNQLPVQDYDSLYDALDEFERIFSKNMELCDTLETKHQLFEKIFGGLISDNKQIDIFEELEKMYDTLETKHQLKEKTFGGLISDQKQIDIPEELEKMCMKLEKIKFVESAYQMKCFIADSFILPSTGLYNDNSVFTIASVRSIDKNKINYSGTQNDLAFLFRKMVEKHYVPGGKKLYSLVSENYTINGKTISAKQFKASFEQATKNNSSHAPSNEMALVLDHLQ